PQLGRQRRAIGAAVSHAFDGPIGAAALFGSDLLDEHCKEAFALRSARANGLCEFLLERAPRNRFPSRLFSAFQHERSLMKMTCVSGRAPFLPVWRASHNM